MDTLSSLLARLQRLPQRWLVTGAAGFIGSHLIEALLRAGQEVISLDNFATGHRKNLVQVEKSVGPEAWARHRFVLGDIRDIATCREVCEDVDYVLHHAALGSVPRSIVDPLESNAVNIAGFVNMLMAAHEAKVKRFVYAASSSTYGDHPDLPKVEDKIGRPLSPYAVTKYVNELYADVFARCYGIDTIGLRYFNVFGARQDPEGPYAAVIPCWVRGILTGQPVNINGDGETTRDFCYVSNVVQANLLAATAQHPAALNEIYNVAVGGRTSLNELFFVLRDLLAPFSTCDAQLLQPVYRDFRAGDVRHSQADISKISRLLGYAPTHSVRAGLEEALTWYVQDFRSTQGAPALTAAG